MTVIKTTLTTSGNSVAVRLPKDLLRISDLGNAVTLEAKEGKIIIRTAADPRAGWRDKITALAKQCDPSSGFDDLDAAAGDGLESAPWDGPTFEEWQQKDHGRLS